MHQSSLENMKKFREKYLRGREGRPLLIFDLGSFNINGSYKPFFDEPGWTYRGLDLQQGPNVDLVLRDPYIFEGIGSGTADVFISGQAFEHIEFFWLSMLEIGRVLKTGGFVASLRLPGATSIDTQWIAGGSTPTVSQRCANLPALNSKRST